MAYQYFNANVVNPKTGEQGMWYYTGMTDAQVAAASISTSERYREVEGDVPDATTGDPKAIAQIKAAYSQDYPSQPVDPSSGMVQVLAQTTAFGDFGEVLAEPKAMVEPVVKPAIKPSWVWLGAMAIGAVLLMSKQKRTRA